MSTTTKPVDKKRKQTEEQIFYNFMQIVQSFPQYTVSEHLWQLLRAKEVMAEKAFFWSNDTLLKKIEDYKDELDRELALPETED